MWILGSFKKDFVCFYLAALLMAAGLRLLPAEQEAQNLWLLVFAMQGFLDAGHQYATAWRTYLNRSERKRSLIYFIAPVVIFLGVYSWVHFEVPGLFTFLAYNAIFHNVRQLAGVSKWYQKLNHRSRGASTYFLYSLCLLPLMILILKNLGETSTTYLPASILQLLDPRWQDLLKILYVGAIVSWLAYEIRLAIKFGAEWNRISSIGLPALLHGASYLLGRTALQMSLPILIAHGSSYIAIVAMTAKRTSHSEWKVRSIWLGVGATCLLLGTAEFLLRQSVHSFAKSEFAFRAALMLTPTFTHYFFDSFLWKRSHPESRVIYSASEPQISAA